MLTNDRYPNGVALGRAWAPPSGARSITRDDGRVHQGLRAAAPAEAKVESTALDLASLVSVRTFAAAWLLSKNIHSPEESGAALARLITDPALASTNGRYFEGLHEIRSSVDSYDQGRASELWQTSAALTGIA